MVAKVKTNIRQLQRNLKRRETTSFAFAMKRAGDRAAKLSEKVLKDQAKKRMTIRRRNFPVFVVRKGRVRRGSATLSKNPMVFNHSNIEDIMDLQVHGGIRKPEKSQFLLIRSNRAQWGRSFTPGQRSRQYVSGREGRLVIYRRLVRRDRVVGFLRKSVRVRQHYRPYDTLPQITETANRLGLLYLRAEVAAWSRRYGSPAV